MASKAKELQEEAIQKLHNSLSQYPQCKGIVDFFSGIFYQKNSDKKMEVSIGQEVDGGFISVIKSIIKEPLVKTYDSQGVPMVYAENRKGNNLTISFERVQSSESVSDALYVRYAEFAVKIRLLSC